MGRRLGRGMAALLASVLLFCSAYGCAGGQPKAGPADSAAAISFPRVGVGIGGHPILGVFKVSLRALPPMAL